MSNKPISIFNEPSRQPLPTEPKLKEHGTAVIKGALGSIPVLGGVLAEELGLILASPLARRRDDWFADLAQHIAGHESPRTTKLYDRRVEEISLDEVERIVI